MPFTHTPSAYIHTLTSLNGGTGGQFGDVTAASPKGLALHGSGEGYIAAVSNTASTAVATFPTAVNSAEPYHIAILWEYNTGDLRACNVNVRRLTGTTNNTLSGVQFQIQTDGKLSYNAGGSVGFGQRTFVSGRKYVFWITSGGSYVTFGCSDYADNSTGFYGMSETIGTNAGIQYQERAYNYLHYQGTGNEVLGYDGLAEILFQWRSTSHRILGYGVNKGGWGGFTHANAKMGTALARFTTTGAAATDGGTYAIIPNNFDGTNAKVIEHHHQSSGPWLSGNMEPMMCVLADRGYLATTIQGATSTAGAADSVSSNWGGPTGLSWRQDRSDWTMNQFTVTGMGSIGVSMGSLNAFELHRTNPGRYRFLLGISGVADLSYAHATEGFASLINAGHGTTTYAQVASKDPKANPSNFTTIPVHLRFGSADTTLNKTKHFDEFITALSGAGVTVTSETISGANHLDNAMFDATQVANKVDELFATDVTPPTVYSANINTAGTTLTVDFVEGMSGSGTGISLSGGFTASSPSGSGFRRTYTVSPTVGSHITGLTLSYTPGNLTDLSANALASFSGFAVTNNSTADTVAPSVPANLAALTGNTIAKFTWSASTGSPSGYQYRIDGGSAVEAGAVLFAFTDATNTAHTVEVRAYDAAANYSSWSSAVTFTPSAGGAGGLINGGLVKR